MSKRIAIFASGAGTNAQTILDFFAKNEEVTVALIVSNKTDAGVVAIAKAHHIPVLILTKELFLDSSFLLEKLKEIDFIVLAGFLWLIPPFLVAHFPSKIINIHPSLLPKYGGKGMYGMKVHQAVFENKEKQTGITIHFVNEHFDEGEVIAQYETSVLSTDTPMTIQQKVQVLEHRYFASTVAQVLSENRDV